MLQSGFFKLQDGGTLHYNVSSCLPKSTFFIHGNLASNNWWLPLENEFKVLFPQASSKMIMGEFKGCGKSSAPRTEVDVDMHLFATQFCDLIASLNLKEKINLVGHSTGGLIAALMLSKRPELFDKAVLLDPVGANGVTFNSAMIEAFEAMKVDKALTATVIGSTIHNNSNDEFFKTTLVEDAFHSVKTVGHWVLKALDQLNIVEEVKLIQHPVLVLHGEHDQLLPMSDSKNLATLMKNGHFQIISGQGHCSNIENPKKLADVLSKFLFL